MSRRKSTIFTFTVLSFALLLLIILAKPDLAFAGKTAKPGPQAGDVLIAGGDTSGTLVGGLINLATSTNSTTAAEVYDSKPDKFRTVGSLKNSREAVYSAVPLPNTKTLYAGGSFCHPQCYNATGTSGCGVGGPACGSSTFTGFQCDGLNTAELYSEGPGPSSFALTPNMTTARSGPTATLITGSGTALDGKVLITGGSTGSTFLGLSGFTSAPAGCGPAGQVAENTAEIYDPVANTFTPTTNPIPGCPAGESPFTTPSCTSGLPAVCPNGVYTPITTASQSGNTVTITDTTNPAGLIVGAGVTILGLTPNNLNGAFPVSSIGTGTFSYTSPVSQTATGSGNGVSVADTFQCGLVDSSAALLGNGDVLITGGDYQQFLGTSSPQAFIFIPGTQTFVQVPPMNVARELAGITPLPDGRVLVAGGLTGASGSCTQQNLPGEVSVTTNSSAEIFDPLVSPPTWTLTFGSSATPGAAGGMSVPRIGTVELFTTGSVAGLAIAAGGVDVEAGNPTTSPPTCSAVTSLRQTAQTATDLFDETADSGAGAFTATGALHQAREGYAVALLNGHAKFANDLIVFGGACTTNTFGLNSYVIGTSSASNCTPAAPTSNYYEYFNPTTGTWTLGTGGVPATPANAPAYTLLP